ncbi:aquaporin [Streptomyces sp. NPDC058335]|uniref:aquaporin n=1 Tax=Streptomyces sp. NPDC058335 TaxID=3346451 RepID=UPI003669277B
MRQGAGRRGCSVPVHRICPWFRAQAASGGGPVGVGRGLGTALMLLAVTALARRESRLHDRLASAHASVLVDAVISGGVVALLNASPLGRIRGAHMNPAVTIALWAVRRLSAVRCRSASRPSSWDPCWARSRADWCRYARASCAELICWTSPRRQLPLCPRAAGLLPARPSAWPGGPGMARRTSLVRALCRSAAAGRTVAGCPFR